MLKKQIRQNADPSTTPFGISNGSISLGVTAIAVGIYLSFIAVLLPLTNNHLYGLYGFSQELTHAGSSDTPWREHVHPKPGYDGQFYFRLALDPFTDKREAFGIDLDAPLMRQQRILLPFFTWLIARGDPVITPPVMMAINLAAVAGCAFASSLLLIGLGVSAWYGILFALYPGFAISAGRFLTEPLTLFMILSSLLMLVRRKHLAASILLSLAVFSRETATLVVAAGFFTWLTKKPLRNGANDYFSPHVSFWLYPTLAFVLWQIWLYCNWSSLLFDNATSANLGPPFVGFFLAICENITKSNPETGFYLVMTSAVVAYQVFISRTILGAPLLLRVSWICYLLLATCIGIAQWRDSPGFLRILTELNVLGLLAYLIVKKRPGRLFVSLWLAAWLLTAGAEWYHLYLIQKALLTS